ncbi:DNA-protecting protein DprA [Candidatus Falkowbacteria bacterium]|nr:MAG: DNA-protecting protein DprA [Candidatus Falkowbacteria bacterium]
MQEKHFLLALSQCPTLSPSRLKRLRGFFNSWEKIWNASETNLLKSGMQAIEVTELINFRKTFEIEKYLDQLESLRIEFITTDELLYPKLLLHIHNPPLVLYYRGNLEIFDQPSIAVVGPRQASFYGKQVVKKIISELTQAGFLIISGLALGIDTEAHQVTLDNNGKTAAVLGTGLDTIYPSINKSLAEEIIKDGCLLSEFPPDTPPLKNNFPRRNRIIAGLAQATLVIEASEKSGALITARFALAENREVMAVPGSIFSPSSQGTNNLIKLGAWPITETQDIFSILGMNVTLDQTPTATKLQASEKEEEILKFLEFEPRHINELVELTQLDMSTINSRLTIMEINGLVKNIGNMQYIRIL